VISITKLPIREKLILIIMSTTVATLLLVGIALAVIDQYSARENMSVRMSTMGKIIADRSTAAITFDDQQGATEILAALVKEKAIIGACIYKGSDVFATYHEKSAGKCPPRSDRIGHQFNDKYFNLFQTIDLDGETIGVLYLSASLDELDERLGWFLLVFIIVMLIASLAAFFIAVGQQAFISQPILRLANVADKVSSGADYSIKTPLHESNDEIAALYRAFNEMLEQVHQRESALRDSEEQVRLLLNSTAEAIYGIDTEGKCTFVNQACINMLGFDKDSDLLGEDIHSLIHYSYSDGADYPKEKCLIYKASQSGSEAHCDEEVFWRKDGSSFAVEYWSHPVFRDKGCIGAVVTFLNVSDRIEADRKIKENERNLEVTLNSIGDAVIATDADGKVARMNPVAEKLTGWSFEEAKGLSLKTIFPIIHASTREPIESPVDKVLVRGETIYLQNHTALISKGGTEYQISDSAAPIRDDGVTLGMVLTFNDVTEQYRLRQVASKSKRDLQAIMDNSPAVIYVKDIKGKFTFINKQFEALFHINSGAVLDKTLHDIFPKDVADKLQRNDENVIMNKRALEMEESVPLDDGMHVYIAIKFPLFNEANEVYAVCGISTDITEHRNQEEQLRRSQKMDALGNLTGGIAHDYNNLLGIIMGYAEQLNERLTDDPRSSKYARGIQHSAARGAKLTQKLLSFTRQKLPMKKVLIINDLLIEQRMMLEKTLTARIKLNYTLADNLWPIELDAGDLEDAIVNVSINALHAMEGGGELTLRTSNEKINEVDGQQMQLEAGDYVLLSITDTGCGMEKSVADRVFDPFYSTKGDRGTGLGLSQVYGFVERSGGAIKVYSEVGQGSHFSLYFPRSNSSELENMKIAAIHKKELRGDETILLVDDEPALVDLAQDILSDQGYRILTAYDGMQALSVLRQEAVDLVITDVIMHNMDGGELVKQVRQLYPHIKIQVVSGFADERYINLGEKLLRENILYKPYTSNALLLRARKLLDETMEEGLGVKLIAENTLVGRTVLVMDDEEDVRELFHLNLEKLGCKAILASNSDEALNLFQQSLEGETPFDIVILDLNIPGDLGGKEVAAKMRSMHPQVKIIVSSGNTLGAEMSNFKQHGFDAALEKVFDRKKIKEIFESLLFKRS